jgi:hypothetical protein
MNTSCKGRVGEIMRAKFRWENCWLLGSSTAYLIEVSKKDDRNEVLERLTLDDKRRAQSNEYISHVKSWAENNPDLANSESIYVLFSEDGKNGKLVDPEFAYSGLWNAYNPLCAVDFKLFSLSDIVNASKQGSI